MRKRQWKAELRVAFPAPPPKDRERFLRTLPSPRLTYSGFFVSQLFYIRRRVWAGSALLLLFCVTLSFLSGSLPGGSGFPNNLWATAALLPFFALTAIMELTRSSCWQMEELERSCRFDLHQIVMVRLTLLGGGNLMALLVVLVLLQGIVPFGLGRLALYLLTPYLLTSALCLLVLNRIRVREAALGGCAAVAGLTSVLVLAGNMIWKFFEPNYLGWWLVILALSVWLLGKQLYHFMQDTEENNGAYA